MTRPEAVAADGRGLLKRYGGRAVVDGIDFRIAPGECFGFLGPNGAGKTTTMRMLGCLTPRDGGALWVLGHDPDREPRALKRRLGVVAQGENLDLELSVRENLVVYARYFGITGAPARERAGALLAFARLEDRADDAVERLSGGMRRRLQIARALVSSPELVLLDEPTTGLDPQARHAVWDRLRSLRAEGATLVLTTHYMDEAAQLCDRLVIMDEGRIAREGEPDRLVANEVGREVVELSLAPADLPGLLASAAPLRGHQQLDDGVWLFTDDASATLDAVSRSGIAATRRAVRPAGLEDVFLSLTGRHLRDDP